MNRIYFSATLQNGSGAKMSDFTRSSQRILTVVSPPVSAGEVSAGLRKLTRALAQSGANINSGILGGDDGYGALYENEVFGMHPYCWCEQYNCPWCATCFCPEDAFTYTLAGTRINEEEYYRIGGYSGPGRSHFDVGKACRWCAPGAIFAPNFWHKPSGTWVTWYKYIGRGMSIHLGAEWAAILSESLQSIPLGLSGVSLKLTPPTFGPTRAEERQTPL